jgi:hypothetical protein
MCLSPFMREAERAGFEPAVRFDPHAALAKQGNDDATTNSAMTSVPNQTALALPLAQNGSTTSPDPDLARLCSAWPMLPDHIRAAVLALVATVR